MHIKPNTRNSTSLTEFLISHLSWPELAETPEWEALEEAWSEQQTRVAVTALDVIASHYGRQLASHEKALLQSVADSLQQALYLKAA